MANHTRSASFPSSKSNLKPNPVMVKISQELQKLQQRESSSNGSPLDTIRIALSGLSGLYKLCIKDTLLVVPASHDDSHVEVAEGAAKLIHLCAAVKAAVVNLREAVSDTGNVSGYFSLRKETARTAKALAVSLRQLEATLVSGGEPVSEVTRARAVRCVSIITLSVVDSLLHMLMAKSKSNTTKSLMSKLISRKAVAAAAVAETGNEIGDVDVALHAAVFEDTVEVELRVRLEKLESGLRGVEDGLSSIATHLTKIRTSLLNNISF